MTKKRILVSLCSLAVVAALAYLFVIAATVSQMDDAYAQLGAAEMVIAYLRDHEGVWPNSWEDLQPYFDEHNGMVSGWSYEKFQQHIHISFAVDATELRRQACASDQVTFDVIHANAFFAPQFGDGPNAMLHGFFRSE